MNISIDVVVPYPLLVVPAINMYVGKSWTHHNNNDPMLNLRALRQRAMSWHIKPDVHNSCISFNNGIKHMIFAFK